MSSNRFKASLAQPPSQPLLGTWLMSGAPAIAEAMGLCGFDFLVVDMEHSPIDIVDAISMLRAIAGTPAEPVVRLAWNDQVMVKRVLDGGARNLMFPYIQSSEEARMAVAYTRYPPHGVRGVAAVHRGSRYGRTSDYFKTANDEIAVIIQLETPEAIGQLAEIAAVPGVDALFVGPGDLSAALGRIGEVAHPQVQALIARAAQAARTAGKPIGIVGANPEMVGRFLSYGYDWVAVASDIGMMTGHAVEWVAAIRKQGDASAATTGAESANSGAAPAY
ncbi:MAG: 2-dehydro-3-deoxyglucarate aldolase [Gammaproteobacteria bacterium]|nr:2-dehydro-3-deoxyglucarate aldolase [Gammaproteobacteria bacterium]